MLQKPYLSRYEFHLQSYKINSDITLRTKGGGESSDDDEYHLDGTTLTEKIENSNNDNYIIESATRKNSISGNEDEYYSFGTVMTRAKEDSDPDFFLIYEDN